MGKFEIEQSFETCNFESSIAIMVLGKWYNSTWYGRTMTISRIKSDTIGTDTIATGTMVPNIP